MKSYIDLEQSKKLAEILPLKSADMHYERVYFEGKQSDWFIQLGAPIKSDDIIPCWSLAVLLDILPDGTDIVKDKADTENEKYMCTVGIKDDVISTFGNNPVDTCVGMILKLKQSNLL